MKSVRALVSIAAGLCLLQSETSAQQPTTEGDAFNEVEIAARSERVGRFAPFAVARKGVPVARLGSSDWRSSWTVLSFYAEFVSGEVGDDWAVRRILGDSRNDETTVDWAYFADCPAVAEQLEALETLQPPAADAPGLGHESNFGILFVSAVNPIYRFWTTTPARTTASADWREFEITTGLNTPLSEWFEASLTALEPCWTDTPPAEQ